MWLRVPNARHWNSTAWMPFLALLPASPSILDLRLSLLAMEDLARRDEAGRQEVESWVEISYAAPRCFKAKPIVNPR
jgi:hypothetical protein